MVRFTRVLHLGPGGTPLVLQAGKAFAAAALPVARAKELPVIQRADAGPGSWCQSLSALPNHGLKALAFAATEASPVCFTTGASGSGGTWTQAGPFQVRRDRARRIWHLAGLSQIAQPAFHNRRRR